ncbi:MAG: cytochrome b/b6 domain-containing protein [Candidatus Eremiobacterales bacterium]
MKQRIYRHPVVVRLTHWLSALALFVLAMSGMQIFNAHPALYASDASTFQSPVLSISGSADMDHPAGWVQMGSSRFYTTHILGYGPDGQGGEAVRAFPSWATIPAYQDLADGRRWHLFFAWIFVICALLYARWAFDLRPTLADLRALPAALKAHLLPWRVKPRAHLNPMQKLSYFGVVFVVAPVIILSGLSLGPSVDSWAPWLPALFGGRQFARIWHFGGMIALMGFFVVHLSMVALTGVWNNVRSMITGWFVVEPELAFSTTAVNTSPVSTPPFEAPPVDAPPSPAAEGEST